ncbi:TRAP transporter substrate-binding protein [Corticicoccus populi]|uniref:TRAP transporter substrate-binding protein n=1 Tax=Corticicoccus populi TaxID=1812821 RepID=A0ABW5X060_9STAP
MKRFTLAVLAALSFLSACSEDSGSASAGKTDESGVTHWKMTHISDGNHLWHRTAVEFADLVDEKTDGKVQIEIFPNSQLGSEVDNINSIRYGATDLTITGETLEVWSPNAVMLAVPYAFDSQEHMRRVIEGDLGEKIENDIKKDVGLTPLFYMEREPRNLTSNYPINHPDDLRGFSMRVPNVPLFLDAWSQAGAQPQVISLSEVFTALQQGVIDGQENPNDLIRSSGFYEVQDYINETEHVRSWIYVVVGSEQLEALPEDQQRAVLEAAEEAKVYSQDLLEEEAETVRTALEETGVEFNNQVDQDAMREAMMPALESYFNDEQLELYNAILESGNGGDAE